MAHNKSDDESGEKGDKEINEIEVKVEKSVEGAIEKDETPGGPADQLEGKSNKQDERSESTLQLRDHLESLPQELYDRIYDLTFTAVPKIRIYATRAYIDHDSLDTRYFERIISINKKLLYLLHVDRRSREKFAKSFFGDPTSFLAIYSFAMTKIFIERRHLELVPELIYIRNWKVKREIRDNRIRNGLLNLGFGAIVAEKFEIMDENYFLARFEERAYMATYGKT